jgi:hypothetical protein
MRPLGLLSSIDQPGPVDGHDTLGAGRLGQVGPVGYTGALPNTNPTPPFATNRATTTAAPRNTSAATSHSPPKDPRRVR